MDEDDKVRRNLVVASAAVLLCSFLNVSVPTLVNRLMSGSSMVSPLTLDPVRLWAATVAVLVYLVMRFRFAHSTMQSWVEFKREWGNLRYKVLQSTIVAYVARAMSGDGTSPIFEMNLQELAEKRRRFEQGEKRTPADGNVELRVQSVTLQGSSGGVLFESLFPHRANVVEVSAAAPTPFVLGAVRSRWMTFRVGTELLFYSQSAMQVVMPTILGGIALSIALCNLARTALR